MADQRDPAEGGPSAHQIMVDRSSERAKAMNEDVVRHDAASLNAAAAPSLRAPPIAAGRLHRKRNSMANVTTTGQPPFTAEAEAVAKIVPATFAGMPPTAQTFFAVVNADGSLQKNFQALSATRLGTGIYQVLFTHDITGSAYMGTIGLSGSSGSSPAGEIAVVGRAGAPNGVFVQTFNSAGTPTDLGFHLSIHS
jgi:hypothetical protein